MSNPRLPKQVFRQDDVLYAALNESSTELQGLPPGVESYYLMVALAAVESSLGTNCGPRYEPAYDVGGAFWKLSHQQRDLVADYGFAAACSFGPWQMMYCNFPFHQIAGGLTEPSSLLQYSDRQAAISYAADFSSFWNHYVPHFKATSLKQLGEIWNAGHIIPDPAYEKKLVTAYAQVFILFPKEQTAKLASEREPATEHDV